METKFVRKGGTVRRKKSMGLASISKRRNEWCATIKSKRFRIGIDDAMCGLGCACGACLGFFAHTFIVPMPGKSKEHRARVQGQVCAIERHRG